MPIHSPLAAAPDARPVVARCAGMRPEDLGGYEAHRTRKGGDTGHVDKGRSRLNRPLLGKADWVERVRAEVQAMREENFLHEIEGLKRRKRKSELMKRITEGPKDPFRPSRHGPMREIILTAHQDWFGAASDANGGELYDLERQFEETAVTWLRDTFGDDVVHARADRDESAYHIHAIILPRVETEVNGAPRKLLQPSKFDVIRDYEVLQDSVGAAFAAIGLTRGERRKQAIRAALTRGEAPPENPRHVRPKVWRQEQERKLAEREDKVEARDVAIGQREAIAEQAIVEADARNAEADAILGIVEGMAEGQLEISDTDGKKSVVAAKDADPKKIADIQRRAKRSPSGRDKILTALRRAWDRMKPGAEAAAEAKLVREFDDLREAETALSGIVASLPASLRAGIAEPQQKVRAILAGIGARMRRRQRATGPDDRY
jgi:hypothetical protein